jgi:hypothetical protein
MLMVTKAKAWRKQRRKASAPALVNAVAGGSGTQSHEGNPAQVAGDETEQREATETDERTTAKGKERTSDETVAVEDPLSEGDRQQRRQREEEKRPPASWWRVTRFDLLYGLLLSCGIALLCLLWLLLEEYGGVTRRYIWISCLFAPFGTSQPASRPSRQSSSNPLTSHPPVVVWRVIKT